MATVAPIVTQTMKRIQPSKTVADLRNEYWASQAMQSSPLPRGSLEKEFSGQMFHYSRTPDPFYQFDPFKASGTDAWNATGTHGGTLEAARDRGESWKIAELGEELRQTGEGFRALTKDYPFSTKRGSILNLKFRQEKPFLVNGKVGGESRLHMELAEITASDRDFYAYLRNRRYLNTIIAEKQQQIINTGILPYQKRLDEYKATVDETKKQLTLGETSPKYGEAVVTHYLNLSDRAIQVLSESIEKLDKLDAMAITPASNLRPEQMEILGAYIRGQHGPVVGDYLAEVKGYTHIPYINDAEDAGSISYIVLAPHRNLRRSDAEFSKEIGGLLSGVGAAAVGVEAAKETQGQPEQAPAAPKALYPRSKPLFE